MSTSPFDLTGKTAIVTGASSGLGRHFAEVLARAGARVILAARRVDRLEALAAKITERGGKSLALAMDVASRASVDEALSAAQEAGWIPDLLINNAGVAQPEPFLKASEEVWNRTIDVNLKGVFRVGQAVAQRLAAAGKPGAIVNIASLLGTVVQPTQAAYAASKAGVVHLTRAMALELGRHEIRVNAIAPGYFVTEMNREFFETDKGQVLAKRLFPRRTGQLDELDGALLLLSSDAGSYITGTTITVDGGTHLAGV